MVTPETLDTLADPICELLWQLETDILCDMAKRLAKMDGVDEASVWQAKMLLQSAGLTKTTKRLVKTYQKDVRAKLWQAINKAFDESTQNDAQAIGGKRLKGFDISRGMQATLKATLANVGGNLERLTRTIAKDTELLFVQKANQGYMQVASGAFDYKQAVQSMCDELAAGGIILVEYPKTTRTIEAAVRANVLTGIAQATAAKTLQDCADLECDLVEVSAHQGARPEHEVWQGGIFSISGTSDKYPPLSETGYGEVWGLCGANCRHSFAPYMEGSPRHWDKAQLKDFKEDTRIIDGKEISRYEAEQKMRHAERMVRKWKRCVAIEDAAGADSTKAHSKVTEWEARVEDIVAQSGEHGNKRFWNYEDRQRIGEGVNLLEDAPF